MTLILFTITFAVGLYGRMLGLDGGLAVGLSLKNLLLGLCIVSIIASLAIRQYKFDPPIGVFGPLLVALLFAAISIWIISTFTPYPHYSVSEASIKLKNKLVDPLLMFAIGYFATHTTRSAIILIRTLVVLVAAGCALTVVDVFNVPDLGLITAREEDGRIQGFIGSAAEFSTIVAACIPILLFGTGWTKGPLRILVAVFALLMIACLILAATRAPFIALLASWFVYAWLRKPESSASVISGAFLFLASIALLTFSLQFTPFWDVVSARFLTGVSSGNLDEISSGRSVIWANVVAEMWERPSSIITGMGWDVYFQAVGHRYATHNIFLDRFYSLGLIGLILYVSAYWTALRLLLETRDLAEAPAARLRFASGLALVVFLISALFADLEIAEFFVYAFAGIGLRFSSRPVLTNSSDINATRPMGVETFAEYRRRGL